MPSRYRIREYECHAAYHVFGRGVNKQRIFIDLTDYQRFISLFRRYLAPEVDRDAQRRAYRPLSGRVDLIAFCLMPNHFHLILRQHDNPVAVTELMQRSLTSYAMYFNRRHDRVGHLFQDRFSASRITTDEHLLTAIGYVHLNPTHPFEFPYSSHRHYVGKSHASWLRSDLGLAAFGSRREYLAFVGSKHGAQLEARLIELDQKTSSGARSVSSDTGRPTTLK